MAGISYKGFSAMKGKDGLYHWDFTFTLFSGTAQDFFEWVDKITF